MRYLLHYLKVTLLFARDGLAALLSVALLMAIGSIPMRLFEYLFDLAGANAGLVAICLAVAGYFIAYVKQHPLPKAPRAQILDIPHS